MNTTLKINQFNENMNAFTPFNLQTFTFSLPEAPPTKTLAEIRMALWIECSKYTPDPELEALDDKLEREYYRDCEEERASFEDDEDTEVNHFNRLNKISFSEKEFELLKKYAISNMISLTDALSYSQVCHNCSTFFEQEEDSLYGNLYCSEKCEKEIEVYGIPCYIKKNSNCRRWDYTECDICSNPDKVALFNARYNTNFDEKKINETKEFARENYLTIPESIYYMSQCHYCGNIDLNYGDIYCNERCCDYIEDFNYDCSHGDYCKLCSNYTSQEEQYLTHRIETTDDSSV